jgi:hypothetical protein
MLALGSSEVGTRRQTPHQSRMYYSRLITQLGCTQSQP